LGCGFCRYTASLSKHNDVVRVDKSEDSLCDYVACAESLPFDDDYFDEVIAIGLLDYSDPELTIREIFRVLKVGGKVRLLVPNSLNPYMMISTRFGENNHVKRAYYEDDLFYLLSDYGFKVIRVFVMGFCFWVPTWFLQELCIPIFKIVDFITMGKFGNNIYMVGEKQ